MPREIVQSPSREVFKTRLGKALSNVVCSNSCPFLDHEVGLETFWGPFLSELLNDSMTRGVHNLYTIHEEKELYLQGEKTVLAYLVYLMK